MMTCIVCGSRLRLKHTVNGLTQFYCLVCQEVDRTADTRRAMEKERRQ